MLINCLRCGKEKNVKPAHIKRGWGKYCSLSCAAYGNKHAKGSIRSEEYRKKMSLSKIGQMTNEDHHQWKGKEASYVAKHNWMTQWFGRPKFCEACGNEESLCYEWANISEEYLRIREDWLRLCGSCHRKFDRVGYKSWNTRRNKYGYSGRLVQSL